MTERKPYQPDDAWVYEHNRDTNGGIYVLNPDYPHPESSVSFDHGMNALATLMGKPSTERLSDGTYRHKWES